MTIRGLQYAIQDAIDEKGVCDNARVKVITTKDKEVGIFAEYIELKYGINGMKHPYKRLTLLGRV